MKAVLLPLTLLLLADVAPAVAASHQPLSEIEDLIATKQDGTGSWIQLFVYRGEKVTVGQKLAVQRNVRGKVIQEYIAGVTGEVTIIRRIAPEPANTILEIGIVPTADACGESESDCELTGND